MTNFTRNCPDCGIELTYKRNNALVFAIKNNSACRSCSTKIRFSRGIKESTRKKLSENMSRNRRNGTIITPSPLGRHHTMKSRKKIAGTIRRIRKLPEQTQKFSLKMINTWSRRAREKTPFCEWCFSEDNLEAHHILPKVKFPQYAYDQNNVRIMCKKCHITCHKQGGY